MYTPEKYFLKYKFKPNVISKNKLLGEKKLYLCIPMQIFKLFVWLMPLMQVIKQ